MKRFLLGLLLTLTVAVPAIAQSDPPDDIKVRAVKMGALEQPNIVTISDPNNSQNTLKVTLTNCKEGWNTGDLFLLIGGRNNTFFLIRGARFIHYYNGEAGKLWNNTIELIVRDKAFCMVDIKK